MVIEIIQWLVKIQEFISLSWLKNKKGMLHMVGGEHSLNISAPQLLRFGIDIVLKILDKGMTPLIIKSMI